MNTRPLLAAGLAGLLASGCGAPSRDLSVVKFPGIDRQSAQTDLDVAVAQLKALYGPMRYKEQRFGFKFDDLAVATRAAVGAAQSEAEVFGLYKKLVGRLEDGHTNVKFSGNATEIASYKLGVFLTPVEGRALVARVDPAAVGFGIALGDELLTLDGQAPFALLPKIKEYEWFANDVSDEHFIYKATDRPFYMTELAPTQPTAHAVFAHADGTTLAVDLVWTAVPDAVAAFKPVGFHGARGTDMTVAGVEEFNVAAQGTLDEFGAQRSFFATPQVSAKFGLVEVEPSDAALQKFGVSRADVTLADGKPAIFAALYRRGAKTILLVRQPSYAPDGDFHKLLKGYKALFDQYSDLADVLVIDQTHNPGGDSSYVLGFFALFIDRQANSVVQMMHADRRWVFDLSKAAADAATGGNAALATSYRLGARLVDQAITAGADLTAPIPMDGFATIQPDAEYHWQKKVLVLANELSGSCGDIFPMLMQRNHRAPIFGERTMGLGGNVEPLITMPTGQTTVRITRGLYTTYHADGAYTQGELMENNGVLPDIHHPLTVSDMRAGFVDYVAAFSDAAVGL